jgi:hypothetical protein
MTAHPAKSLSYVLVGKKISLLLLALGVAMACERAPQLLRPGASIICTPGPLVACAAPGLVLPGVPKLFFTEQDNPLVAGLAPFERQNVNSSACGGTCNFAGCDTAPCTVPLQFEYSVDGVQRDCSLRTPELAVSTCTQHYGGEWTPRLRASRPVFNYGMKKLSATPFQVPQGAISIDTWVPQTLGISHPRGSFFPTTARITIPHSHWACCQGRQTIQRVPGCGTGPCRFRPVRIFR